MMHNLEKTSRLVWLRFFGFKNHYCIFLDQNVFEFKFSKSLFLKVKILDETEINFTLIRIRKLFKILSIQVSLHNLKHIHIIKEEI
jgi:hypothetical protein